MAPSFPLTKGVSAAVPIAICAAACIGSFPHLAQATEILFQDTQVQATFPQVGGSPTWLLEAVVVRADDNQRHPLAAFIDGTPETSPRPMLYVAKELARRGWTTVAVMRPGFGTSQGKEPPDTCSGDFVTLANFSSQTLRETIRFMTPMAYIDPSRSIVVGHSSGGVGAVATTVNPPANLVAGINFDGVIGSQYENGKVDTVCKSADLIKAFASFGARSRIPMLWIYAQNDPYMGPTAAQQYYQAFTGAGGKADFEMAPATPAGTDGHMLYSMPDEVPVWTPYLDKFFATQKLALISPPLSVTYPVVSPPAGLSASGQTGFASYLTQMPHKAFAMSSSHWGSAWLDDSTATATQKALANCTAVTAASDPCKVVNIDDQPSQ